MYPLYNEKRSHFRVDILESLSGQAKILSINNKDIQIEKKAQFTLLDLSAGGMKAEIPLDLPLEFPIVLGISFNFEGQYFTFRARILRKGIQKDTKIFEYGLKFLDISIYDEKRMISCLNRYQIKQVKSNRLKQNLHKQRYFNIIYKMIEILSVPAYILTDQRVIIAANKEAEKAGIKLGDKCYQSIYKKREPCSFCKLEEAKRTDQIVNVKVPFSKGNSLAHWLYLEDGYTLHYFKN